MDEKEEAKKITQMMPFIREEGDDYDGEEEIDYEASSSGHKGVLRNRVLK